MFFFFKQKTAYEIVVSDWSSDVCSSDLLKIERERERARERERETDRQRERETERETESRQTDMTGLNNKNWPRCLG